MALLFTDSIPLLGLLLKPFAPLLPVGAQYIGLWYLACLVLHAGFAAALVRRHAPDALTASCGAALLTLMPALFNRFGHASLCAQWLLLWALWVFVEPRRAHSPWWWAAVTSTAALIHAYLLLMVLAFWSAGTLERLVRAPDRVRTLALAAAALAPAMAIMAVHGAFAGPYVNTGTFGNFPAALDGWWNPLNPDYTALLPSSPRAPDGRGYEGLQYLGAGLLLLVVLMAARLATVGLDDRRRTELVRLLWLLPPFAVFALLAIGPFPLWRGEPLFVPDLPPWLVAALDPVRRHGPPAVARDLHARRRGRPGRDDMEAVSAGSRDGPSAADRRPHADVERGARHQRSRRRPAPLHPHPRSALDGTRRTGECGPVPPAQALRRPAADGGNRVARRPRLPADPLLLRLARGGRHAGEDRRRRTGARGGAARSHPALCAAGRPHAALHRPAGTCP
jgi:hypothetical protein